MKPGTFSRKSKRRTVAPPATVESMQSHSHSVFRLGILGCGTVGGALIRLIQTDADRIAARTGIRLEVSRVAVRNLSADRDVNLPLDRFTRDSASLVNSPDIDLLNRTAPPCSMPARPHALMLWTIGRELRFCFISDTYAMSCTTQCMLLSILV